LEKFNCSHKSQAGFSLVEVMIATGILATALVSLAQLFAISTATNLSARNSGTAMVYAQQKIEQLRGLSYTLDGSGLPITDVTTDTSVYPPAVSGGTGLSPSTDNTLQSNTDGYVDYLDHIGRSLGGGETIPDNTAFIRRWSIEPLPTNPNNIIIIQVLVTRSRDRGTGDLGSVARGVNEARLMTIRSRKVQ
jgi:prepilin-type N-terminal cleavage/methylation domain-containing protein